MSPSFMERKRQIGFLRPTGALWTIRLEMIGYVLVALLLGVSLLEEKRQFSRSWWLWP